MTKRINLVLLFLISGIASASSEQVTFPGAKGEGYPVTETVTATLQLPENGKAPIPAVVILHGSGGIDGRGAFHAEALNKAGIATLEVFMFRSGQRFNGGHTTTLTHAYGALNYLSGRPDIAPKKIGVMGFSWGGNVALRAASKIVHRKFFPEGKPAFAAHAPYYAVWWAHTKLLKDSTADGYGDYAELTDAPVLLFAGGLDDYGAPDAAQQFLNALPDMAKRHIALEFYPEATHGWDQPASRDRTLFDPFANEGKGGQIRFYANRTAADDARVKTVTFFLKAFETAHEENR